MEQLNKINVNFTNLSTIKGKWFEKFNQATFYNYDTTTPVKVNNNVVIPPAQTIAGNVYPTIMEISLNKDEVNDTYFSFDFGASTSPNLQVMYTEYINRPDK